MDDVMLDRPTGTNSTDGFPIYLDYMAPLHASTNFIPSLGLEQQNRER